MKAFFVLVVLLALGAVGYFYGEPILAWSQEILTEWTAQKQGQDAIHRNDWMKAMVVFEAAHEQYPKNPHLAWELGQVYQRQARKYRHHGLLQYVRSDKTPPVKVEKTIQQLSTEAEALFRQVIQAEPEKLETRIALGKLLKDDPGRYMEAVPVYREALRSFPDNPELLEALGDLYKSAGEKRDSEDFSRANVETRNWLYRWAIYYYRLSLKQDPAQYPAYFNLGVLYHLLEDIAEDDRKTNLIDSARAYCNATLLKSGSFETRYNLGLVLVDLGVVDAGFRQLSESVRILSDEDRLPDAQILAKQIQGIRNTMVLRDPTTFQPPEMVAPWLTRCLNPATEGDDKATQEKAEDASKKAP